MNAARYVSVQWPLRLPLANFIPSLPILSFDRLGDRHVRATAVLALLGAIEIGQIGSRHRRSSHFQTPFCFDTAGAAGSGSGRSHKPTRSGRRFLPCSFMQRLQYSALLRVCTWLLRGGRAPTRRLRRIETAPRRAFCREEQRAGPDRKGPEVRSHPAAALFDATAMPPPRWNAGSEPGAITTPEPVKAHPRAT